MSNKLKVNSFFFRYLKQGKTGFEYNGAKAGAHNRAERATPMCLCNCVFTVQFIFSTIFPAKIEAPIRMCAHPQYVNALLEILSSSLQFLLTDL